MTDFNPVENSLKICHFPKHKGERWIDVVEEDREYVEFLLSNFDVKLSDELTEYLEDLLDGDIY